MATFTHPVTGDTLRADTPREVVQLRGRGYLPDNPRRGKAQDAPVVPDGGDVPASEAAETAAPSE